jgi:hypothetical protein
MKKSISHSTVYICDDYFKNKHSPSLKRKICLPSQGDLEDDTESEIIAADEPALHTKYHAKKLLITET